MAQTALLRPGDFDATLTASFDGLVGRRGCHADVYASYAWLSSWLSTLAPSFAKRLRVPAVFRNGRLAGALPLFPYHSVWWSAGHGVRPRSRLLLDDEQPDPDVIGQLTDEIAAAGMRQLALYRLPSWDPATDALITALRSAGYRIATTRRSADRLAMVTGDWQQHVARFQGFAQYADRFATRIQRHWDLTMDEYGREPDFPVASGFQIYADIHARSWKGPMSTTDLVLRARFLEAAERLGWTRMFILRIADVPAAAHLWFRVGKVATWMSTAYDARFAALGPGSILQWWAQQQIFAESAPSIVDLLPGANPQKERLAPECPALISLDATRRTVTNGVTFPARHVMRQRWPGIRGRLRVSRTRSMRRLSGSSRRRPRPPGAALRETAGVQAGRIVVVEPGKAAEPMRAAAIRLDPKPPLRRYLAISTGHRNVEDMTHKWPEGDAWWLAGSGPAALLRVSASGEVREAVRLTGNATVEQVAQAVADALGRAITLRPTTLLHDAALPWGEGLAP